MLSREDNERSFGSEGTPLETCSGFTGISLPSADLVRRAAGNVSGCWEDLVVQDTEGRIGLVDQAQLHRGASLILGATKIADAASTALKFDVTGAVIEQCRPSSARSQFC